MPAELWLIRHGETEWSRSGAHTGRTDLPLTAEGRQKAAELPRLLGHRRFALVLTSPLLRAVDTCRLAGYSREAVIEPNLREWDYGDYEGRTTLDIRKEIPDWSIWTNGVAHGESIDEVASRAGAVIARAGQLDLEQLDGDVALFAHGHILRILASRWIGMPPQAGRRLALSTASVSTLGYERVTRVITRWNLTASE